MPWRSNHPATPDLQHTSAYVSICQHTSAYVSIRQHTSAYVSIRQHTAWRSTQAAPRDLQLPK
jgi:hypothetical protein